MASMYGVEGDFYAVGTIFRDTGINLAEPVPGRVHLGAIKALLKVTVVG